MADSRAVARLRAVMNAAADRGEQQAWLTAAQALHAALERLEPDSAGRARLRADLVTACEVLRRGARSRVGRQWNAETADSVVGPLLRDVLDDRPETSGDQGDADGGSAGPDAEAVFTLAEATRGRVLLDALGGCYRGESGAQSEPALAAQVVAFEPDDADDAVHREMRLVSAVRPVLMPQERSPRQEALDALEALYAGTDRGFDGGADPATLTEVQRRLGPRELLVEYVIPYHPLHPAFSLAALVVSREAATVVPLPLPEQFTSGFIGAVAVDGRAPLDASPLGQLVITARLAVQSEDPVRAVEAGRLLHEVLAEPVLATALARGRDQWVVVPHRQLHPVPWMALVDAAGRPWLTTTTVTVSPSASVWHRLAGRRPAGRAALSLGNPLLGYAGLPDLPEAGLEVEHLQRLWQARGWPVDARTGPHATAAALVAGAASADLVHLATHGSFPRADAGAAHQVLLGMAPGSPGPITVARMRSLDLRRAWCTTLSVCNGGVYLVGTGDEPLGLVAAALEAGTATVVAAQWAVDDAAGRRLMGHVVDALADVGPAEAVRAGALALAGAGEPPRTWAAFVAVGSGRGPDRAGSP